MLPPNCVVVPDGMSYVNAFRALWVHSQPSSFLMGDPFAAEDQAAKVERLDQIIKLFKRSTNFYFDYEGGRLIKSNFSRFPILEVETYDKVNGKGAAMKALEAYHRIDPFNKMDPTDRYQFEFLNTPTGLPPPSPPQPPPAEVLKTVLTQLQVSTTSTTYSPVDYALVTYEEPKAKKGIIIWDYP